jgi:hypothetical protein
MPNLVDIPDNSPNGVVVIIVVIIAVLVLVGIIIYLAVKNKSKTSAITTPPPITCSLPVTPTNINVSSPRPGSVIILWTPVTNATGYKLFRSSSNTVTTTVYEEMRTVDGQTNTITIFTNLSIPTQSFILLASNSCGDSSVSDIQTIVMNCVITIPTNLTLTNNSNGTITCNWNNATNAFCYKLYIQMNNGSIQVTLPANQTTYTFSGVGLITVSVIAANECYESDPVTTSIDTLN